MNPASAQIQYQYQTCPIFLTGGIAGGIDGGTLPIISLLNPGAFPSGITGLAGPNFDLGDSFANFHANPGSSLQKYELGRYPFANQVTAANAIITEPLNISLTMIVVFQPGNSNVANRQSIMTSLKQTLDAHALAGGTYTVLTISYPYVNAILRDLVDASDATMEIPQWRYQWDFEIPLISIADAQNIAQNYNNLMGRVASGQVVQPGADGSITWSGTQPTIGNPGSTAAPSVIPATQAAPTLGGTPNVTTINPGDFAGSGF